MTEPVHVPDVVDTTSPTAIIARLAVIEDEMAFVTNQLARAAYWRTKYKGEIDVASDVFYPRTAGTIPERKSQLTAMLVNDVSRLPEKFNEAEATYQRYTREFDGLDSRKSILQSCLKVHTRESEPRFGSGSHHR